ncbi:TonB-dependent receptor [Dyadobacter sp. CY343]|uniref:SusC/RagA family TonB-linked outer membrane protein n=1 Tax=Dyadobacter sp. CY343 TaxID=2907299 RepID=UPI001F17C8C3|nr:TonB-dependent receptor [Dyadobacter sp. CY343]MCE7059386.1 TonB-dependent receptor [Dyadobacter sp. CY343]
MRQKFRFISIWSAAVFLSLSIEVSAQILALSPQHKVSQERTETQVKQVREVILQLKELYKADILFEEKLLEGLEARGMTVKPKSTLEENLRQLLTPVGLRHRKVKGNSFVILPASTNAAGTPEVTPNQRKGPDHSNLKTLGSEVPRVMIAPQQAEIVVKGRVTDSEKNEALPGVSVLLKGSTAGVITDEKGEFEIKVADTSAVLVFSFIGFTSRETSVGTKSFVSMVLQPALNSLEELVVVGYGTQKKVNLTGSVATMDAKQLSVVPSGNVGNLLAGNLPGLISVQRSGEPGKDDPTLSIRGFGNALVVVDGIVGRDFYRLDPNEIESITILKDAASASVYGVSGGNGVILVTTKKGVSGKPELSYSMNYSVQHVTKYPRLVNSEEFATLKNEAAVNIGGTPVYSQADVQKFRDGSDPINFPNYNYYDLYVRDYTPVVQQNLSVRGGSDKIKYFFLLGGHQATAMWGEGDQTYKKYNFRSNVEAQINDNLKVSVDIGARSETRNDLVQDAYLMASWLQYSWPIVNPKTPDGKISNNNYGLSGYLEPELSGYARNRRNALQGNLAIDYKIPFIDGLNARFLAAYDLLYDDSKHWQKQIKHHVWDPATGTSRVVGGRDSNFLVLGKGENSSSRIQASLNYNKLIANHHNVGALLLYEENEIKGTSISARRDNYVVPIDQLFAGPLLGQTNSGTAMDDGRQSLVGRFSYDFDGKYLLEYSFRYDGSPRFPVERRWGLFSGVSAGWRLSEEKFISDRLPFLGNLKLRGSYGESGNDNTGAFQYLAGYNYPSQTYIMGGNEVSSGLVDAGVPNPNITWERTSMFNAGIDFGLKNHLLDVEFDIFRRQRKGMLGTRALQLPSTFGAGLPAENLNADQTSGMELVVSHSNKISQVKFNISGNVSFSKSKWTDYEQGEFPSQDAYWRNSVQGRWKNRFWGLKAVGQFQSEEEILSSPVQDALGNSTLLPGDIKYQDFNNDGVINDYDGQPLGRGEIPEIMYGLNLNASWKKFSVTMNWQGGANFVMQMQHFLIQPFANDMSTYAYFMDRWHRADITNPDSEWIPGRYPAIRNNGTNNNNRFSSFWLKDASYIRLKALNINYTVDLPQLKRIGVKSLTAFLSGQNLVTFSGLEYMDPETPTGRNSVYPLQKTYNLGFNITF